MENVELVRNSRELPRAEFEKVEQFSGLKWNENSILWHESTSDLCRPVSWTCFDSMHCFYSGGIVGTELDLLMVQLLRHGVTLTSLVDFFKTIVPPKSISPIPSVVERWKQDNHHLALFSSETMTAVTYFGIFVDTLGERLPDSLQPYLQSFRLLRDCCDILHMGDEVVNPVGMGLLAQKLEAHHLAFRQLDGFAAEVKPKWHFSLHVPDCLLRIKFLGSLYVPVGFRTS